MPQPPVALRCASALSTLELGLSAAAEAADQVLHKLDGHPAHLVLCFFTAAHLPHADRIAPYLRSRFPESVIVGCGAEGVISTGREIEDSPAVSLWAAHLPGCTVKPFQVELNDWERMLGKAATSTDELIQRVTLDQARLVLLLADPFSTPVDGLLAVFDMHMTGVPVVGGMASASGQPGGNRLLIGEHVQRTGIVGASVAGPIRLDNIVSQGCKPLGRPLRVTQAQGNVLVELDHKPALAALHELIENLSEPERKALGTTGLFIGRSIDDHKSRLGRGDFLIRGVMGVDQNSGAIAVGDRLHVGGFVQFHVRDATAAREDFELLLSAQAFEDAPALGALLFTCNGRGGRLYGESDVDVSILQHAIGAAAPVSGFFAAGELGPVGPRNFIHGHTASAVILRAE